jgi:hypothetical protein
MPPICDFVGALAVARKPFKKIEETVKKVYGDEALKKTQLYKIICKVKEGKQGGDQRIFDGKRRIRNPTFIADVTPWSPMTGVSPSEDMLRPMACRPGWSMPLSTKIFTCKKKSAQCVPKLLNKEMKNERARICEAFMSLLCRHSMAMLDWIVTMNESAVSFHTP